MLTFAGGEHVGKEVFDVNVRGQDIMFGHKKKTPVLTSSGWMVDNVLKKSGNKAWWKGKKIFVDAEDQGRR